MKCRASSCETEIADGQSYCTVCGIFANDPAKSGWSPGPSDPDRTLAPVKDPLLQLQDVKNSLQELVNGQAGQSGRLHDALAAAIKKMAVAIENLQHERFLLSLKLQQNRLDSDVEREMRRIEPVQPADPNGPHRINWKIGF
jgi:hypothetical protein